MSLFVYWLPVSLVTVGQRVFTHQTEVLEPPRYPLAVGPSSLLGLHGISFISRPLLVPSPLAGKPLPMPCGQLPIIPYASS